jgi:hypothetical protein
MTEARIGWGGELQLSTDGTLGNCAELIEVRSYNAPTDEADEHEVTHLKSPDRRKEYLQGLIDAGEVSATLNYIPGSATDLLLTDALDSGTTRAVRFIIPDPAGAAAWKIETSGFVKRYAPDTVEANAPITATLTLRITGGKTQGAVTDEDNS